MSDVDYRDPDMADCPRCSGFGFIDCHCGGDLCVCDNYGEEECPLCQGEGKISVEAFDEYHERRRAYYAALTDKDVSK